MTTRRTISRLAVLALASVLAVAACGSDEATAPTDADADGTDGDVADDADAAEDSTPPAPQCADFDPLRKPLFGDLHVHTALSLDANLQGTRLRPVDAYRFAKGEEVGIQPYTDEGGALRTAKLARPLDFVAVTDHAEFLGVVTVCLTPGLPGYDHPECVQYRDNPNTAFLNLNSFSAFDQENTQYPQLCGQDAVNCEQPALDAWSEIVAAAEAENDATDACSFTALVGYEWTGNPGTQNLHRNIIFRTGTTPARPTSYMEEAYEEGLWAALRRDCLEGLDDCDVLSIPHNSNLSEGLMFDGTDRNGAPIDAAYAAEQAVMEPLVEIFQHKGDSECRPSTLAGDELCGFEKFPYSTLLGANLDLAGDPKPRDFVRDALGRGLELAQGLGVNPFAFGIIASTDTHLAVSGLVAETAYPGHGGAGAGNRDEVPPGLPDTPAFNPGGLAAVWAEENSREAIFDALRRKETFGTSGPRIVVRFFGGWGYGDALCDAADFAAQGYDGGVPMGGTITSPPAGAAAPAFAVSALRDPGAGADPSTPLERIQIVKGALTAAGMTYEVFDVAGQAAGEATVDIATCETAGPGADALCTVWTDPAFDPAVPAFYYARVLETPTCRWTTRLCAAAGVDCEQPDTVTEGFDGCCDTRFAATIQERAWTSPIWYQP